MKEGRGRRGNPVADNQSVLWWEAGEKKAIIMVEATEVLLGSAFGQGGASSGGGGGDGGGGGGGGKRHEGCQHQLFTQKEVKSELKKKLLSGMKNASERSSKYPDGTFYVVFPS